MTFFSSYHRRALEQDGYVVYAPDEAPLINLASAIAFVRASGHVVIKAHVPQLPRVGMCYRPTRASSIKHGVEPRWVWAVSDDLVVYSTDDRPLMVSIKLKTWHRWVQRTRAVVL